MLRDPLMTLPSFTGNSFHYFTALLGFWLNVTEFSGTEILPCLTTVTDEEWSPFVITQFYLVILLSVDHLTEFYLVDRFFVV